MDRRQPPFTIAALQTLVAAAKARNPDFSELCLLPQQYQELQADLTLKLGSELPDADSDLPVILCGVQLVVWRPCPNVQPTEPAGRYPYPVQ